jgi:pimeloyl-ACP methyl ester carboxylesterase
MSAGRIRRGVVLGGAVLLLIVLLGATYQGVTTAVERRQFPLPGRLVDVGDHQLHLHCLGAGVPTVVLEAPAAGMSSAWGWVQAPVAAATRVCSYDRAGLGWSEAGDAAFAPLAAPSELHALLGASGEPGPYVVAGHGFGALIAHLYASRFGDETAALVLVDAPANDGQAAGGELARVLPAAPWLARMGALRATRLLADEAAGLPELSAGALTAFLNRPDHLTRAAREVAQWNNVATQAAGAPLREGLPVTRVATEGGPPPQFLTDQEDAQRVTAAILTAVATVRAAASPTTP